MKTHPPGKKQTSRRIFPELRHQGYILLPVVMAICLIGGFAFFLNRQAGLNVRMAAGDAEGRQARYIAEAGLDHMTWKLQQANCSGYTEIIDLPFGNDTYSVTVTDQFGNPVTGGSPVVLTATATLDNGVSQTLVRQNVKVYGPGTAVTDLIPIKDAAIRAKTPGTNYGDQLYLTTNGQSTAPERSLLEFDLSTIPATTVIDSAVFQMYLDFWCGKNDTAKAYKVTNQWLEGDGESTGVTWDYRDKSVPEAWNVVGGDYDTATYGSFNVKSTGWYSMDLTSLVQEWLDGSSPNYGIILVPKHAPVSHENIYLSSENTLSANLRPKLTITYSGLTECP
jgi:hypothetical protein